MPLWWGGKNKYEYSWTDEKFLSNNNIGQIDSNSNENGGLIGKKVSKHKDYHVFKNS